MQCIVLAFGVFLVSLVSFSAALIDLTDDSINFNINDNIGFHFDADDWYNNNNWYSTETLHDNFVLVDQKCINKDQCFCSYPNYVFVNKIKVFNCDTSKDYAANLDFRNYGDMYFNQDDYEEAEYKLQWNGNPANPEQKYGKWWGMKYDYGVGNTGQCPVSLSSHHIIPHNRLERYWNWLIDNAPEAFQELASAIVTKIGQAIENGVIAKDIDEYKAGQQALEKALTPKAKSANYNAGPALTEWKKVKGVYAWMEGNVFQGPEGMVRDDDAEAGFEVASAAIIDIHADAAKYRALKAIYNEMVNPTTAKAKWVVEKLIMYCIQGKFTDFNINNWKFEEKGGDAHQWRYALKTYGRRRRLLSYNNYNNYNNYEIFNSMNIMIDYDDWSDNRKWNVINRNKKCINDYNCFCRKSLSLNINFINAFSCNSATGMDNIDISAAMMMVPNNLKYSADDPTPKPPNYNGRGDKYASDMFGNMAVFTDRYCVIPVKIYEIIDVNTIRQFWNAVANRNKIKFLKRLLDAIRKNVDGDVNLKAWIKALYEETHTNNNGAGIPGGDHTKLRVKLIWMKGNLYIGPHQTFRSDNPAGTFDPTVKTIVGDLQTFIYLREVSNRMDQYIVNPRVDTKVGVTKLNEQQTIKRVAYIMGKYFVGGPEFGEDEAEVRTFTRSQWNIYQDKWRVVP